MQDATLNQGTKILSIFKDTPSEQIQAILASGLLADLRDANIARINRDDFRRLCGLKPLIPTFSITHDGSHKTSELKKMGQYNWANDWITDEHFPIQPHPPVKRVIEFVEVDYDPTSEDILREFKSHGLERPTYEDALYFGIQHKDEQRKNPVVFLHKPVLDPGSGQPVLVLVGLAGGRGLGLDWFDRGWYRNYRFAGVRESIPADKQA